jgi:hypothetical protein
VLVKPRKYDHPEHFDDVIRDFNSSERDIPSPLKDLLYEQCGHRCTICSAPYCEIHHIDNLQESGLTQYENLIVLCPNCHTRVHKENNPSKNQLRQYKLKLEVVYSLPIIGKLTTDEKELVKEIMRLPSEIEMLNFSKRYWEEIESSDQEEAKIIFRKKVGFHNLELDEIIKTEYGSLVTLSDGNHVSVNIYIRATSKAVRWIKYLKQSDRLSLLD